ncbi:hypothetical protein, partial [Methanocorpusculum vombati]
NAARPALGGMASDEKQMRRAKLAERSDASAKSRVLFFRYPTHHLPPNSFQKNILEESTQSFCGITTLRDTRSFPLMTL